MIKIGPSCYREHHSYLAIQKHGKRNRFEMEGDNQCVGSYYIYILHLNSWVLYGWNCLKYITKCVAIFFTFNSLLKQWPLLWTVFKQLSNTLREVNLYLKNLKEKELTVGQTFLNMPHRVCVKIIWYNM